MTEATQDSPKVWTLANVITLSRLIVAVPLAWAVVQGGGRPSIWLFIVYLAAAATDGIDGYVARARQETSDLGTTLDPVADKVFGTLLFGALVLVGLLPAWLLIVLVVKELVLLIGGLFLLGREGRTISARPLGKIATIVMFVGFGALLVGWTEPGVGLSTMGVALSVGAGIDYGIYLLRRG